MGRKLIDNEVKSNAEAVIQKSKKVYFINNKRI